MKRKLLKVLFPSIGLSSFILSCNSGFDGKNGTRIIYFEGTKNVSQSVEFKNGWKNGPWLEYYKNGNLKYKTYYVNDTIRDTSFYFHENGKVASFQILRDGNKEGCWKKFNKEGNLYNVVCYVKNRLEGNSINYSYNSGRVLENFSYKNGFKDGKQETFYLNGKPKSSCQYSDNRPCLGLQEWSETGKKINNDFKIFMSESNKVLLTGKLTLIAKLENSKDDDRVAIISDEGSGNIISTSYYFIRKGDHFESEFTVGRGAFIMRKLKIAAFRKTDMGNVMIQTTSYNLSVNHF